MKEQTVTFSNNGITLAGTMALPATDGPYPAVVMVPGSGQVDRDESHKKMKINTFNEFARLLADRGIASLRYDKRGVGESQGDYYATGFHDNVGDTRAAFEWLKNSEEIRTDRVFLLGHSEGAFIATRLAGSGLDTAGIILLAGGAQSGEASLVWQAEQVIKGMKGFQKWLIDTLHIDALKAQRKSIEKIKKSTKDSYRVQMITKLNAKWMRELLAYDPAEDLASITVPVLAMTGSKDIQVDPQDLARMAGLIKAPFEHHIIPDVTHMLRADPGQASLSTYKEQVKKPVDPRLTGLMLEWMEKQLKGSDGG